jgi:hypothetical protein
MRIGPYVARYKLRVDAGWRARAVGVELENGGRTSLSLSSDGAGHWTREGEPLSDLDNCVDVDLEWSPSTNTLPIRRLDAFARRIKSGQRRLGSISVARGGATRANP